MTKNIMNCEKNNHDKSRTGGFCSTIKLGIIATGRIANKFVQDAELVVGVNISGVFNIHKNSAEQFAKKYNLPFFETDYEKFLEKVDAVYIASPHETHYDYAKNALLAGKHVLCEKPMALSLEQANKLFALAREKKLIFLEAIKTAYCPGYKQLIECVQSGKIGEIVSIDARFTKLMPFQSRELANKKDSGSIFELITYPLLPIFQILGTQYDQIDFKSYYVKNHCADIYTRVILDYTKATCSATVGLGVKSEGDLVISGTEGYIYVPAPWWKTESFEIRYEDPLKRDKYVFDFLGNGLQYELLEFLNQIHFKKKLKESQEISCAIVNVIDLFKKGYRRKNNYL